MNGATDEVIFQKARRVVIAEWQNIVYSEYLPVVLGERMTCHADFSYITSIHTCIHFLRFYLYLLAVIFAKFLSTSHFYIYINI